jgi:7-cyano-7-deazaguanine synthase
MKTMDNKCLVILSGGQDSTTCLAIAKSKFKEVHAVTFNYGQRHLTEIESAIKIAEKLNLASHEIIDLGQGILKGSSPLVSNNELGVYKNVDELPGGVEPTFVYSRNILFLTIASNRAAVMGINDIFIGVCEADYAGYFDCRLDFINVMSKALGEGVYGSPDAFKIHTPLMSLTKSESVILAKELLGDKFDSVMELTHTCYAGVKGGCGQCHACLIRDRGFKDAGMIDPIWKFRNAPVFS